MLKDEVRDEKAAARIYISDDVRVDPAAFSASLGDQVLSLEPKAVRVLILLIENHGRAVSKDELLREVWSGSTVSENALTRVVAMLRKALGDDVREARYIATIPTLGYRWIAKVTHAEPTPSQMRQPWWMAIIAAACLAGLALWTMNGRVTAKPAAGAERSIQITSSEHYDSGPVFAPDGSSIAYSSNRSGNFEIYVKPLAVGAREVQITADGLQNIQPAWSPDGKYIAYHSMAKRGILMVPALGGHATVLSGFGSSPAWTPKSDGVVFQSQAAFSVAYVDKALLTGSTIWQVGLQGAAPEELSAGRGAPGRHTQPRVSKDGKRILFAAQLDNGASELWTIDRQGSPAEVLLEKFGPLTHPQFSPDGRSVFFAGGAKGYDTLYRLSIERGKAIGQPEEVLNSGQNTIASFALSADGKQLAYCSGTLRSNLWSMQDGKAAKPFTKDTSLRNSLPAFSPDGRRVAWFIARQGMPGKVWIRDFDDGEAFPLTPGLTTNSIPRWMPDGESIIYASVLKDGSIWQVQLGGGSPKVIRTVAPMSSHLWVSPDGKDLVYDRLELGISNLWRTALKGGPEKQFTFEKESVNFPVWSPDGKWIAAGSARGDTTRLSIYPASGGPGKVLVDEPGQSWAGGWSKDSSRILYAGERGGVWEMYSAELLSGKVEQLTHDGNPGTFVRFPTWSPDNDRILFEKATMTGNIFMMRLGSEN